MKQFIDDMINMTEGQKLITYWWLWVILVVLYVFVLLLTYKHTPPYK